MTDSTFPSPDDDFEPTSGGPAGPFERLMLYSPDGLNGYVLQHLGPGPFFTAQPSDRLRVTDIEGRVTECTWSDIASDPRFWLRRDAQIMVTDPELLLDDLPFSADGVAWVSTRGDEVFGEGDWELTVNGESMSFSLRDLDVRYEEPAPNVRAGTWVEVTCAGTSMSTGDIGWTLSMDEHGGLWSYQWGCYDDYVGRENTSDLVALVNELVTRLEPMVYDIVAITSEVFTLGELAPAIAWLIEHDDDGEEDPQICCIDFDGAWSEAPKRN